VVVMKMVRTLRQESSRRTIMVFFSDAFRENFLFSQIVRRISRNLDVDEKSGAGKFEGWLKL
jgi:hypothetical protein